MTSTTQMSTTQMSIEEITNPNTLSAILKMAAIRLSSTSTIDLKDQSVYDHLSLIADISDKLLKGDK